MSQRRGRQRERMPRPTNTPSTSDNTTDSAEIPTVTPRPSRMRTRLRPSKMTLIPKSATAHLLFDESGRDGHGQEDHQVGDDQEDQRF